jgi:hypothetical protein
VAIDASAPGAGKSRWGLWLFLLVLLGASLFALYTWFVLTWNYSNGERAGYVQKFSKKGWVCKTWEGELAMVSMPGTLTEKFLFTVRDAAVADKINKTMGKRVSLVYEEHIGIPSTCFGETGHVVVDAKPVDADIMMPAAAPVQAPVAAPATAPAAPAPAAPK